LCDAQLNVRENKVLVDVDRFLVVFCGLAKLGFDEVELRAVIVDVWVVLVLGECGCEVGFRGVGIGFWS
jgi:hypothetical protein